MSGSVESSKYPYSSKLANKAPAYQLLRLEEAELAWTTSRVEASLPRTELMDKWLAKRQATLERLGREIREATAMELGPKSGEVRASPKGPLHDLLTQLSPVIKEAAEAAKRRTVLPPAPSWFRVAVRHPELPSPGHSWLYGLNWGRMGGDDRSPVPRWESPNDHPQMKWVNAKRLGLVSRWRGKSLPTYPDEELTCWYRADELDELSVRILDYASLEARPLSADDRLLTRHINVVLARLVWEVLLSRYMFLHTDRLEPVDKPGVREARVGAYKEFLSQQGLEPPEDDEVTPIFGRRRDVLRPNEVNERFIAGGAALESDASQESVKQTMTLLSFARHLSVTESYLGSGPPEADTNRVSAPVRGLLRYFPEWKGKRSAADD